VFDAFGNADGPVGRRVADGGFGEVVDVAEPVAVGAGLSCSAGSTKGPCPRTTRSGKWCPRSR
jgi:hypothetical protein